MKVSKIEESKRKETQRRHSTVVTFARDRKRVECVKFQQGKVDEKDKAEKKTRRGK